MRLFDLGGQTAFVTGAGSGIGQAIAIGLAEAGAQVACFDLPAVATWPVPSSVSRPTAAVPWPWKAR